MKEIVHGNTARAKLEKGVDILANAVKVTLGPRGRNVVIGKDYETPLITNDGVTIAKEISLKDHFENMGAELVKEVSVKTNDVAGDGTTTACVLAQAIIKEGNKNFVAGANPIILRKGIQKATKVCVDHLKSISKPVETAKEIEQVATISAGDEEIGKLISQAMQKVGKDGVITVEQSQTTQTSLTTIKGVQFDRGYLSPYMCTDMEKMIAELENPKIFITDKKISTINEIIPLLEQLVGSGEKLVIIAEDIESEPLATLVLNKLRGVLNCVAVKAPSFGEKRKELLQDIAVLTGATILSEDLGIELKNATLEHLGSAKNIKVEKETTTIVGGSGDTQKINDRIYNIKELINKNNSIYDKEELEKRLAGLSGGVAVIKVGSATEVEMKEKKLRIEDALAATKAASVEGVVAGGGVALLKTIPVLKAFTNELKGDEKTGAEIVLKALEAPIRQIANNSGVDSGVVVNTILEHNSNTFGFDALNLEYVDMFEKGILDPTKVTRSALENASSLSATLLTTECAIVEIKEK